MPTSIVQNGGSKSLGRWGGLVRGQVFGLTGLGDRTTLSVFSTSDFKEQQTVQIGHEFRLGPNGLSISRHLHLCLGAADRPRCARARQDAAQHLRGRLPVRSPPGHVASAARLGWITSTRTSRLNHALDLTRDRLRVGFVRIGLDTQKTDFDNAGYSLAEPPLRANAILELRQGMHILGATDCGPGFVDCTGIGDIAPSRLEGRSDATVFRFTGYGEARPVPKLTLALGIRAQYAWKPLLSFEEFSAGNYTAGRGYDPGALLGDRGFGSQAELRYGSRIPASARKAAVEGYFFWDHALVRNRDRLVVVEGSEHLDSVGGGAESVSTGSRSTHPSPFHSLASGSTTSGPTRAFFSR